MIYASYLTHSNATFNGSNLISFPKKGFSLKFDSTSTFGLL